MHDNPFHTGLLKYFGVVEIEQSNEMLYGPKSQMG